MDPTKSFNLVATRSLIGDSKATRYIDNLSEIFNPAAHSLIGDSQATTSGDPTLFSNLEALIETLVSSSCIQIIGVPGPASTENIHHLSLNIEKHKLASIS